ncbi:flagellin N-terminal helical domain-containing protein [Planctomicrobium piriforme]|uniref:Flagellin n=1 Tax=Planctomicrobium piriforme TaxID=1576369 RepID=A0A1I3HNX2_9PLAN|nr:flagellin [Planctomicrobium piriforme]SFI37210.1 flagellin [Planctomicrobium piriforme]
MALSIANNITSLNAQNNLNKANTALATSVERLSSGLKVNKGADGPAALVISEKQRAQIAGLQQAIENSNKAVSLVQTAEGALGEINDLLVKVRSLALDSANAGVNDSDALAANQAEIDNALDTINRIASNTQFGTKKLLDGSAGVKGTANDADVTVLKGTADTTAGAYAVSISTAAQRATVSAGTDQTAALAADETVTVNGVSIELSAGLSQGQVVSKINEYTDQTGVTADVDSGALRLTSQQYGSDASISVISNVAGGATSTGLGTSLATDSGVDIVGTIGGTSYTGKGNVLTATSGVAKGLALQLATAGADPTSTVTGAQGTVTVTNNSLTFQIGPNQNQTAKVTINKVDASSLGIGVTGNQFSNLSQIDVSSATKAQDAIGVIDQAISDVTNLRGDLGAFQQNTLTSTANNLRTTLENTTNAESVIRDTDFASEIANFTKNQVLVQAGTSILSNANQMPQLVLSLLK